MKRLLVAGGLVTAAVLAPATAYADHVCVTSGGQPVYCAPDPEDILATINPPDEICVKHGSTNIVCVF
ncbi:MAG TPA: hypothetical protein VNA20_15645 [Frankiaceae bacterium]|nr:hypothetical protein [Frankiaceae bacterium]